MEYSIISSGVHITISPRPDRDTRSTGPEHLQSTSISTLTCKEKMDYLIVRRYLPENKAWRTQVLSLLPLTTRSRPSDTATHVISSSKETLAINQRTKLFALYHESVEYAEARGQGAW